uniref:Uncharacterized protein n=1 Tax=viral metagenome TaxID=1070528 RepID=A0A6M3L806_9ZZZZ
MKVTKIEISEEEFCISHNCGGGHVHSQLSQVRKITLSTDGGRKFSFMQSLSEDPHTHLPVINKT